MKNINIKMKSALTLLALACSMQAFATKSESEVQLQCEDTGHNIAITFEENEIQLIPAYKINKAKTASKDYDNKVGGIPFYLLLDHPLFNNANITFIGSTGLTFLADSKQYYFDDYFRLKPTLKKKLFKIYQFKRVDPTPKTITFSFSFVIRMNCKGVIDFSTIEEVKK